MMKLHQYTKKTIALSLAAVMAAGLAGCRASDEIQKIVYTQDATEVDDTEVTRRWEQEAEEQDDISDELQEEEDTEKNEEEMEADQISADETVEETVPEEADETETPDTEETAQVASAEETGNNQIANDSDEGTGSSQVSGNAAGESEVSDSSSENETDDDTDETESVASGQTSDSESSSSETSDGQADEEEPDEEEPDEEEPDEEEPDESSGDDSESEGTQEDDEGTTSEEGDNTSGEGTESRKQIYDSDGNLIALPDNVSMIVAAGEAALITQMLGGEGVLLGASSDFLENTLVQSVFADEGIAEVATLWSGDGSSPMSDESFEELLELNPDCVLEISGETNFSSSQESALKEAQIYIVTLSDLSSSDDIQAAVETVGQLLDDHAVGNTTSVDLAEQYVAYEEALVAEVQGKKGTFCKYLSNSDYKDYFTNISATTSNGDFAVVFWDWDDSFSFSYSYNGTEYISQSGGVLVDRSGFANPAFYYMAVAGVMNTSESGDESFLTPYMPFYRFSASSLTDEDQNQNGVQIGHGFSQIAIFHTTNIGYSSSGDLVSCLVSAGSGTKDSYYSISSDYMLSGYGFWATLGYTSFSSSSPYYVSGAYAWLGTDRFPYAIAANSEIKTKMDTEKERSDSLYAIRLWGIEADGCSYTLSFNQNATVKTVLNHYTTHRQDYEIVVNPSGCGDWLTGSVESVLESVWISNLYWGDDTYSDSDMEKAIQEFYETFYRHSLSSSELADILDGE